MIGSWLLLSVLVAEPGVTELRAGERPLAVLLVATSKRSEGLPSTAAVLRAADLSLRKTTGLAIESPERLGITGTSLADCPPETILGCALASATSAPVAPPFVLTVTLLKIGSAPMRVGISILDVAEGTQRRARAEDAAQLEDALAEIAWSLRAAEVDVDGLERFFADAGGGMARFLDDRGVERPGAISVAVDGPGKTVSLDGNVLGTMTGARGRIVDARPGRREVRIEPADGFSPIDVVLLAGGTSTAAFVRPVEASSDPLRVGFRVGGPLLAAGGATAIIVAISLRGGARSLCLGRQASDQTCEDLGSAHLGFDASGPPTSVRSDVNPSGLDLLALGVALAGAGGTLALGGWLGTLDESPPWWLGLLAIGVGGALYGASALVGSP